MDKEDALFTTVVGSWPLSNTHSNMVKVFTDLIQIGLDYPCYPPARSARPARLPRRAACGTRHHADPGHAPAGRGGRAVSAVGGLRVSLAARDVRHADRRGDGSDRAGGHGVAGGEIGSMGTPGQFDILAADPGSDARRGRLFCG